MDKMDNSTQANDTQANNSNNSAALAEIKELLIQHKKEIRNLRTDIGWDITMAIVQLIMMMMLNFMAINSTINELKK